MQAEAKPRWLVEVSGDLGVLGDVAEFLTPLNVNIGEQTGERYLTSPRFEAISDAKTVLDLANEILAVVDGMLSITTGGSGHLVVKGITRAGDEGMPATQYIFPEGIPSGSRFGIPTIWREGDPPPQREDHPFHRMLDLAGSDERSWKVLRMIGSEPLDWSTLYRVYEMIERDVGNISAKGWASKNTLSLFQRTANHPAATGYDARHGELSTEPPPQPMDIKRARELIRHIVDKWLKEKTRK